MRSFFLIAGAVTTACAAYQYFFADDQDDHPPVHQRDPYERHRQSVDFADDQDDHPPQPPAHQHDPSERRWQSADFADQDDRPPPPPAHRRDSHERHARGRTQPSQRAHITPEDSKSLRARAKQAGDLMSLCYKQSEEASDRVRAEALSDMGRCHKLEMETYNARASAIIYNENNRNRDAREVDLHRLFVKEAIDYSEKAVTVARQRGYSEIRFIVGQGNHSEGGIPLLKPALQEDMQMRGHHVEVDPNNPGVLVVRLGSS